ncbi:hypothetical protein PTKIN_Ptkin04bG0182600 [Pterospermum kingtungense]
MAEHEQVKPLAPGAFQTRSDDEEALSTQSKLKKKRYIQCCGCVTALLLILAVVILVLFFTVFRIHDPKIRMNSVTIQQLELLPNGSLRTDVNVTLLADVSVKNPNVATFKFNNSTTLIYYGGKVVGEAYHIQGRVKARRTLRRNVTVAIVPDKILAVPSLISDINSGALNISSYTNVLGRVKILSIIKKNVVVKVNCSMTYRISGGDFHGEGCKPELDF